MNKRILCLGIVSMFLVTGVTNLSAMEIKINSDLNIVNDLQLDQQQTSFWEGWGISSTDHAWGQSFVPTLEKISLIKLRLSRDGNPKGELVLLLCNHLENIGLISVTVPMDTIPLAEHENYNKGDWVDFRFNEDLNVNPGQVYYIALIPNYDFSDCDNHIAFAGDDYNPYPRGCAWYCYFGEWTDEEPHGYYNNLDFCFKTYGIGDINNRQPQKPAKPEGTTNGTIGIEYTYSTFAIEPDGEKVKYGWDWDGDEEVDTDTGWMVDWHDSGETVTFKNYGGWASSGNYIVRVIAIDENGWKSEWSDALTVNISKSKVFNHSFFLCFLQQHPTFYQLLQRFFNISKTNSLFLI